MYLETPFEAMKFIINGKVQEYE
jgi:hypothetical protein